MSVIFKNIIQQKRHASNVIKYEFMSFVKKKKILLSITSGVPLNMSHVVTSPRKSIVLSDEFLVHNNDAQYGSPI